jgi:hypothetical protein
MSDFVFITATIVFYAICALYVHWCDKIIGPDDFPATGDDARPAADEPAAVIDSGVDATSGVKA